MRELSLFTGAGGGLLGTHLLGWKAIGYVEWDEYCQRIIRARIDDGILPVAPIFADVREFVKSGAAREYRGFADVVTAGFPCQPFSVAGKQQGADDPRNMWPATIDTIRAVRPRYCLLENVPALLSSGYFGTVIGDLAESGYDCRWRILSAAELGAPHKRDRLWIVCHARGRYGGRDSTRKSKRIGVDVEQDALSPTRRKQGTNGTYPPGDVADAAQQFGYGRDDYTGNSLGRESFPESGNDGWQGDVANAHGTGHNEQWRAEPKSEKHKAIECRSWWETEPDVGRVADGVAARVDRLKALGNGQVPAVVRAAWRLLTEAQ